MPVAPLELEYQYAIEDFPGDPREHRRKIAQSVARTILNQQEILAFLNKNVWVYAPEVDLTNGGANDQTTVDIATSLPDTIEEMEILCRGVTTNTASQPGVIQLGTAASYVTAGYSGIGLSVVAGAANETGFTNGFHPGRDADISASDAFTGVVKLSRWDPAEDFWFAGGILDNGTGEAYGVSGSVDIAADLTRVRMISNDGIATFNGGLVRVRYR